MYINDMPNCSNLSPKLFADDAVLTFQHSCLKSLIENANCELIKSNNWMKLNKLSINYTKTKAMFITHKNVCKQCSIKIGTHTIERVRQIKYLGVIFDGKLTWRPHIKYLCCKLSSGSWALYKLKSYVDTATLKLVYYSLIHSHLQYCIATWGSASVTALDPLKKLRKRVVRSISESSFRAHTAPLFSQLQLLKINDIYKFEIAKIMHSVTSKQSLYTTQNIVETIFIHHYNTRQTTKRNHFFPRKRTESGKKFLSFIGPQIWYGVPSNLKHVSSQFKKKFKAHLIDQYI